MLLGPIVLLIVFLVIGYWFQWDWNIIAIGVLMLFLTTFAVFVSDMIGQMLGWWSVIY